MMTNPDLDAILNSLDVDPTDDEFRSALRRERVRQAVREVMQEERDRLKAQEPVPGMEFLTPAQLQEKVAARPPRQWLLRGLWIESTPCVIGAAEKTGKTVALCDLAVAVACGKTWMGHYPVEHPGPVVLFVAEDDEDEIARRLTAIAEFHGVALADLGDVHVCFSAPNLSSDESLAMVEAKLQEVKPVVALLDPLYLAAGEDADASSLFRMGMLLNRFKAVCLGTRTAPCVVTHFKKSMGSTGSDQITGVGPTAWARTIIWGSATSYAVEEGKHVSTIVWNAKGNSIQPQTVSIRRTMWADDPDDLNSPLHYVSEPVANAAEASAVKTATGKGVTSAVERAFQALTRNGGWMDKVAAQEEDARHLPLKMDGSLASPLKYDTMYKALEGLAKDGLVQSDVRGSEKVYALPGVAKPGANGSTTTTLSGTFATKDSGQNFDVNPFAPDVDF